MTTTAAALIEKLKQVPPTTLVKVIQSWDTYRYGCEDLDITPVSENFEYIKGTEKSPEHWLILGSE